HHAAVRRVHVVLRSDDARQDATTVDQHRRRRLVARALDTQHHHADHCLRNQHPPAKTRRAVERYPTALRRVVRYRVVVCVAAGACACGWPPSGRCCSINRIVLMTSSARCSCTSFLRSSIGSVDGSGRSFGAGSFGASTTMSGVMPLPWMERPFGAKYFAVLSRMPESWDVRLICCTDPVLTVCVTSTISRPQPGIATATPLLAP